MSFDQTGLPDPDATSPATHWVSAARRGDSNALASVFTILRRRLLRIVAARTGRAVHELDPDVEDVVQDALLQALRDFDRHEFPSSGALLRWITTIAMNDVRDRARGRHVRRDLVEIRTAMHSALGDRSQRTPLENVYESELERAADAALASLDTEDRDILVMRNFEGLSASEIAVELGLRTEEAARARVLRARRRLERALGDLLRES